MGAVSIFTLFGRLMEMPQHVFTIWGNDSYNASLKMDNGHELSFGWGPTHYANTRGETGTELDLLYRALEIEVAIIPAGYNRISEVRGWQDAAQIGDLIDDLESE